MNELTIVADPYGPVLSEVDVAAGPVAHRGGFLVDDDVHTGAGHPVRVTNLVATAAGRVKGRQVTPSCWTTMLKALGSALTTWLRPMVNRW